eukprot:108930-Rhodomonas_salina.1
MLGADEPSASPRNARPGASLVADGSRMVACGASGGGGAVWCGEGARCELRGMALVNNTAQ